MVRIVASTQLRKKVAICIERQSGANWVSNGLEEEENFMSVPKKSFFWCGCGQVCTLWGRNEVHVAYLHIFFVRLRTFLLCVESRGQTLASMMRAAVVVVNISEVCCLILKKQNAQQTSSNRIFFLGFFPGAYQKVIWPWSANICGGAESILAQPHTQVLLIWRHVGV